MNFSTYGDTYIYVLCQVEVMKNRSILIIHEKKYKYLNQKLNHKYKG